MLSNARSAALLGACTALAVVASLSGCVTDSAPHPDSISLTPGSFCAQYVPVTYAPTDAPSTRQQVDRNNQWFLAHCANNGNGTLTPPN